MAGDTNISTQIDLKIKGRELQGLKRDLKDTFDPRTITNLNKALQRSTSLINDLNKVTRSLLNTQKEQSKSAPYKEMEKDLRAARKEAEKLRRELDRGPGSGAGRGGGGGGSGGGDNGPGRGSGRAPRGIFGGFGWGERETAGDYWARQQSRQLPMPTAAGAAMGLGAIPIAGAAMGGGLMAAFQMYGSALRYQQAVVSSAPFAHVGGYAGNLVYTASAGYGRQAGAPVSGPSILPIPAGQNVAYNTGAVPARLPGLGAGVGRLPNMMDAMGPGLPGMGPGPAGMFTATPNAGLASVGFQPTALNNSSSYLLAHGQAKYTGSALNIYQGIGAQYGVDPGAALQEAAQLGQGFGRRPSADDYAAAKAAGILHGVSLQQFGAVGQAARRTMGADAVGNGTGVVANLIGMAENNDLQGTEVSDYLSGIQSILKQQGDMGGRSGIMGFKAADDALRGYGITGAAVGNIGQGWASGASNVAKNGAGGASEFMLLSAAGYTGAGGIGEYMDKISEIENPDNAAALLPKYVDKFLARGSGLSVTTNARMLRQNLRRDFGTEVGVDASEKMVRGGSAQVTGMLSSGELTLAGSKSAAENVGILSTEAKQEGDRITAGRESAEAVQKLNGLLIDFASVMGGTVGPVIAKMIDAGRQMASGDMTGAVITLTGLSGSTTAPPGAHPPGPAPLPPGRAGM